MSKNKKTGKKPVKGKVEENDDDWDAILAEEAKNNGLAVEKSASTQLADAPPPPPPPQTSSEEKAPEEGVSLDFVLKYTL